MWNIYALRTNFRTSLFSCLAHVSIVSPKAKRVQIVALKTAGISNRDINKQLDVSRKTVFNVWKQYTETVTTSNKPIPGWRRSIRTKPIVQAVIKREKRNPRRSMRKTASRLRISRSSIRRIFKNDQRLTAYRDQPIHLLPAASQTETTWKGQKGDGGDAVHRRPCLHLVQREDLHSGGSYQHAEW